MKRFLVILFKFRRILHWMFQNVYTLPCQRLISTAISSEDKISIIVPHADDELIGNYSILKNYKTVLFYYRKYGSNRDIENIQRRDNEIEELAKRFNSEIEIIDENNSLKRALLRNGITTVFIPPLVDWHKEHTDIARIVLDSTSDLKMKVFSYEISVPIMSERNLFISIYSPFSCFTKWRHFKEIYKSQINLPVSRFVIKDLYFQRSKLVFCDKFHFIERAENTKISTNIFLKEHINDLKKIRKLAYDEWKKIEI